MIKRHSPREILPAGIEVWITPGILRSQSFHDSESKAENDGEGGSNEVAVIEDKEKFVWHELDWTESM